VGKSRLARRLTTILPAITLAEAIEATRLHRVAGLTGDRTALVTTRPCRAPHQTISDVGLIGGGHVPTPGDVSLAHHGMRCLDEWPECRRHVLAALRQAAGTDGRRRVGVREEAARLAQHPAVQGAPGVLRWPTVGAAAAVRRPGGQQRRSEHTHHRD
jgi:hypothetical protein